MSSVVSFSVIYDQVLAQMESEQALQSMLPRVRSIDELLLIGADRYLSAMCLRIFRAGLKHSVVDKLWPNFEVSFNHFEPLSLAALSDENLETLMQNEGIIKHWGKIKAIRTNAQLINEMAQNHGSFGQWLASWPSQDIIGLWAEITKRGAHLGGKSAASFLRYMGKDTFLLTDDVVRVLASLDIIEGNPNTKRNLAIIQGQFNDWHQETGKPYSHLSRIISMSA